MLLIRRYTSLFLVSVFILGVVAVVPVSAQRERGSGDDSNKAGAQERAAAARQIAEKAQERTEQRTAVLQVASTIQADQRSKVKELREEAKRLVTEKRKDGQTKSVEARQNACEKRQESLTRKTDNFAGNAARHLETFDSVYEKVEAFEAEKNLVADGASQLKAVIEAKRTVVLGEIKVLSALNSDIDCTTEDPAQSVAAIKTAVKSTREAIQGYRVAVKDLVVVLNTAASQQEKETN